ncbi:hypothetical protein JYB64_00095 [Algoriphagus aestuarii]|nr:hypothetical protein [Algoriphagus aestuarii]
MKSFFLVILMLFNWGYSSACDCLMIKNLEEAQKSSFEENELIFVGKVIELNSDGSYALEIIESFKGNENGLTKVYGFPDEFSCPIIPNNLYETWLVYSNLDLDGKISISQCGLSRSFQFPFYYGSRLLPPPPPLGLNDPLDILDLESLTIEYKKRALDELKNEIEF